MNNEYMYIGDSRKRYKVAANLSSQVMFHKCTDRQKYSITTALLQVNKDRTCALISHACVVTEGRSGVDISFLGPVGDGFALAVEKRRCLSGRLGSCASVAICPRVNGNAY